LNLKKELRSELKLIVKYYLIHIKIVDNFRVIHIFNQAYYTLKAIPFTYYLTSYTKFFTSY